VTTKESPPRPASLLIVNESCESREVLRTVFERQGVTIHDATQPDEGLELMERCRPDVVILDIDLDESGDDAIPQAYNAASRSSDTALVILGKLRRPVDLPPEHIIAKPYHFAPLIHTIERLLARAPTPQAASDSRVS